MRKSWKRSAAERNQKHPPRRHGDTEKAKAKVKKQNLNTGDTEKLGGRGGLKKLGMQA